MEQNILIKTIVIREEVDTTNRAVGESNYRIIATMPISQFKVAPSVCFSTYLKNIGRVNNIFLSEIQKTLFINLPQNSNVAINYFEWGTAYFEPASTPESIAKLESENAQEEVRA